MARKILLADDSVTAQNMGRRILTDAGYDVITVNNGSAALKKISEQKPDMIVLDVYMPGYGGLEVCQRLKEARDTSRIPVLLTVGKLEPFKPEEARRVRADAFIVKPFEASELLAALAKLEDRIVPQGTLKGKPKSAYSFDAVSTMEDFGDSDTGWKSRLNVPPPHAKRKDRDAEEEQEPTPRKSATVPVKETAKDAAKDKQKEKGPAKEAAPAEEAAPVAEAKPATEVRPATVPKPEVEAKPATEAPKLPDDITQAEIAAITAAAQALEEKRAKEEAATLKQEQDKLDKKDKTEEKAAAEAPAAMTSSTPASTELEVKPPPTEAGLEQAGQDKPDQEKKDKLEAEELETKAPIGEEIVEARDIQKAPAAEAVKKESLPEERSSVSSESTETVPELAVVAPPSETTKVAEEKPAETDAAPAIAASARDNDKSPDTSEEEAEKEKAEAVEQKDKEDFMPPEKVSEEEVAAVLESLGPAADPEGPFLAAVAVAAVGTNGRSGAIGPRWIAEAAEVTGDEATLMLEREMEKALAAMAAVEGARNGHATAMSEGRSSSMSINDIRSESTVAVAVAVPDFADTERTASGSFAVSDSASVAPFIELSVVPVVSYGPITGPVVPVEDVTVSSSEIAPGEEAPVVAAPENEAAPARDFEADSPGKNKDSKEKSGPESDMASAWDQLRTVRENVVGPEFTAQLADVAAQALESTSARAEAPSAPRTPSEESPSDTPNASALAHIVDNLLAELKPKLMEELARKLEEEKKGKK